MLTGKPYAIVIQWKPWTPWSQDMPKSIAVCIFHPLKSESTMFWSLSVKVSTFGGSTAPGKLANLNGFYHWTLLLTREGIGCPLCLSTLQIETVLWVEQLISNSIWGNADKLLRLSKASKLIMHGWTLRNVTNLPTCIQARKPFLATKPGHQDYCTHSSHAQLVLGARA